MSSTTVRKISLNVVRGSVRVNEASHYVSNSVDMFLPMAVSILFQAGVWYLSSQTQSMQGKVSPRLNPTDVKKHNIKGT